MKPTAYRISFEALAEGPGVEMAAVITGDGGHVARLETSADLTSFKGEAIIEADTAEEALGKLRASVEQAAAAAQTKITLTMNDVTPSAGIG